MRVNTRAGVNLLKRPPLINRQAAPEPSSQRIGSRASQMWTVAPHRCAAFLLQLASILLMERYGRDTGSVGH